MEEKWDFPVFRRYPDGKTYFRIDSYESFEEIKVMGNFYQVHCYQAEKLPDRNLIEDMINQEDEFWEKVSKEDFEHFLAFCTHNLSKLD